MYRYLLNKKFFKDNQVKELSAQRLVYSKILMPEVTNLADKFVRNLTDRAEAEALRIREEKDPEAILKLLRSKCDPLNSGILQGKVLDYEEQLMPRIIEMLIRSGNDIFIEHAVDIIPKCKQNYSNALLNILDEIRNPYALSLVCIAIGFIGGETAIPIMHNKYMELKNLYPDKDYEQGPLLALAEMKARFYRGV